LINSREYADWMAVYLKHPWGDDWEQAAMIGSTLINLKRTRRQLVVTSDDIIPGQRYRVKRKSAESMESMFKSFVKGRVDG
jgi:hypothetical protein